jgi:hypothetical protein
MSDDATPRMQIPMPSVLTQDAPAFANRDPGTSGETGPIYDEAERDAAKASADEPITEYARELWSALDEVAEYLRDDLARGGAARPGSAPSVLVTPDQWQEWAEVYAAILSVLAGPKGDEGYGEQEARLEYQNGLLYRG